MREPFRTLLEPFFDHPILGPHLTGWEPDWEGLVTDERVDWISRGEKVMVEAAQAFAGRGLGPPLAHLGILDHDLRTRVAEALIISCRDHA